jgi:flagellar assembly factor FliW
MTELEEERIMPTATAPMLIPAMNLTFQHDLPGFKGAQHFVVEPLGDDSESVFARLRCTDDVELSTTTIKNLTLLVTSPGILWRDYEVQLDDAMVDGLGLSGADDAALLVIVHPREPLSQSTANLYSPIVVNRITGQADQLVPALSESEVGWSVTTPFPTDRDD